MLCAICRQFARKRIATFAGGGSDTGAACGAGFKLANYGYVLETGSIRMDSDADTLSASNSIVEAYLGA
ncbi:MAG: hypothetical protein HY834_20665 [Devosia nanyangense]|uniref:Uncharacterized protein n=1 Tax=Devosia nanyangense TaxID=1228055 RepID=A0A933P0M6_9HYPH|nr:hypothetical protein [Devosia nanyangense]